MKAGCLTTKRVFSILLLLIFFFAILSVCVMPRDLVPEAVCFSVVPLAAACFLLVGNGLERSSRCFSRRALWGSALAAAVLFMIQLPLEHLLDAPLTDASRVASAGYPFAAGIAAYFRYLFPCIVAAAAFFDLLNLMAAVVAEPGAALPEPRWPAWLPMALVVSVSLLSILSAYPTYLFHPDSSGVWEEVLAYDWNDAHSIGYTLFVFLCTRVARTPYMVVLVQTGMWLLVNAYVLRLLERLQLGRRAVMTYTLLGIFLFTPYFYLRTMLKDTVFSLSVLAYYAALTAILRLDNRKKLDYIVLALSAYCCIMFRHVGIIPVALGLLCVFSVLWHRRADGCRRVARRLLSAALCGILLAGAVRYGVGFGLLHAKKVPSYVAAGTSLGLTCALVSSGAELDPADAALLEQVMPLEKWAACYDPYNVDTSSREYSTIGSDVYKISELALTDDIARLNLKYLFRYPKVLLTALFDYTTIVWEITRPMGIDEWILVDNIPEDQYALREKYSCTFLSLFGVTHEYATFEFRSPIVRSFAFRGGIWAYSIVISMLILLLKRYRDAVRALLLPFAAIVVMMLFTVPVPDTRYVLPVMDCAIFYLTIALYSKKQSPCAIDDAGADYQ